MESHTLLRPLFNKSLKAVRGLGDRDAHQQLANAGNTDRGSGQTHSGSVWGWKITVVLGAEGPTQLSTSRTNPFLGCRRGAVTVCLHLGGSALGHLAALFWDYGGTDHGDGFPAVKKSCFPHGSHAVDRKDGCVYITKPLP